MLLINLILNWVVRHNISDTNIFIKTISVLLKKVIKFISFKNIITICDVRNDIVLEFFSFYINYYYYYLPLSFLINK